MREVPDRARGGLLAALSLPDPEAPSSLSVTGKHSSTQGQGRFDSFRERRQYPLQRRRYMSGNYIIWTVVGILLIIALLIFIF